MILLKMTTQYGSFEKLCESQKEAESYVFDSKLEGATVLFAKVDCTTPEEYAWMLLEKLANMHNPENYNPIQ